MIVLAVVTALLAAAIFWRLRRLTVSYPPPRYAVGVDLGRWGDAYLSFMAIERFAFSVIRPESFIVTTVT